MEKVSRKKREFCAVDYEHVRVVPSRDGLNTARTQTTKKYKLRSVEEWIDTTYDDMKDLFRFLKTPSEEAQKALASYRAALERSFSKEARSLPMPRRQISKRNVRAERDSSDIDSEEDKEEEVSEQEEDEDA